MCACDFNYVCFQHRGTIDDWQWYLEEGPRELEEQQRDRDRYTESPGKPWSERER